MDLRFTESSDGKTIDLKTGQQFTIALEESPTTGYRWHFVGNGEPVVSLTSDSFQASSPQLGSPGTHEWLLQAKSPGQVTIEMKLAREWDPHNPTRSLLLYLKVA